MGRAWSHREAAGGQVELGSRTCFWGILEFAIKIVVSIILSNLKKAQIHSGITLTKVVFAMSESPKFHHITKIQISYRKKERSVGIAKHSILFFRNTEKRYPYVTTAAAAAAAAAAVAAARQQQLPAPVRSLGLAVVFCLRCRVCVLFLCASWFVPRCPGCAVSASG